MPPGTKLSQLSRGSASLETGRGQAAAHPALAILERSRAARRIGKTASPETGGTTQTTRPALAILERSRAARRERSRAAIRLRACEP